MFKGSLMGQADLVLHVLVGNPARGTGMEHDDP